MPACRLPHEQRRDVILDAADSLFAEHGYAFTRLEDIAANSDVSKQMLARYFASKQDLLLAVLGRHHDCLLQRLDTTASAADVPGRLAQRAEGWFGYIDDHPNAARLLFADITGIPEVAAFHQQMRDRARQDVANILRQETTLPDDALEPVAEMVRAGTVGLATWWIEHRSVPRAEIVAMALRIWTRGLSTPPA